MQRNSLRRQSNRLLVRLEGISVRSQWSRHDRGWSRFVTSFGRTTGGRQRSHGLTTRLLMLRFPSNVLKFLVASVNSTLEVIFDL